MLTTFWDECSVGSIFLLPYKQNVQKTHTIVRNSVRAVSPKPRNHLKSRSKIIVTHSHGHDDTAKVCTQIFIFIDTTTDRRMHEKALFDTLLRNLYKQRTPLASDINYPTPSQIIRRMHDSRILCIFSSITNGPQDLICFFAVPMCVLCTFPHSLASMMQK